MTTVYELPFEYFHRTAPLFAAAWFDEPYMETVLSGRQPGRIFVDDPENPSAALMCRTYEFFLAGVVKDSLRRFITDAPAEPDVWQKFYGLTPLSDAWIETVQLDRVYEVIPRHNFRWVGAPIMDWQAALPDGARVVPIDRALAERIDREWHETIGLLWEGYDNYMRGGFGFCLLLGDELGSMANGDGVGEALVNVGVRTSEAHRRQGLAKLVCSAFIEHALSIDLEPTWDTDGMNEPSKLLARSLGFEEGRPFTELASPQRKPLDLSHGLWHAEAVDDGITAWKRDR